MSVNTETGSAQGQTTVLEKEGVYASLFEKINLTPASSLGDINAFLDDAALADAPAGERLTAAMQVFMDCIRKSGLRVEKLDKTLIDHHIAELDFQISRQLDAVMHHEEFQKVESLWRGLKQLVDNTDYYLTAIYLEHGAAGLKQDPELALRYYRKAADEGNPQAQAYVGDKLAPVDMAPEVARQMRRCAAEQGEGKAAAMLGINLQGQGHYQDALEIFQLGVAAGDTTSAFALNQGFDGSDPDDEFYYLGQRADPERARRYKVISKILSDYAYASPVVPEINDIVPLPPAPLPEWDGEIKWVEERKANIPPPKPSEALIAELARKKQLNPATGRPLPESPDFEKGNVAQLLCRSGQPCPKSGYWQPAWIPHDGSADNAIRYFREGTVMPTQTVEMFRSRPWPLQDKWLREERPVDWRMVGEA